MCGVMIFVDLIIFVVVIFVDVFVKVEGVELGVWYECVLFNVLFVGFWFILDSELVFVGDVGMIEFNDGMWWFGVEFNMFW